MIGQKVAHYRITAAIGAGGMGAVYRATDTRLGREVALKVLPPEMASNPEWLRRFEREARSVAALNHPHVVTIYSVDEFEGMHFLTMELVEGESLGRLIPDGGMLVPQLLDIAAGLADGLTAAHEKGIVHRDLKPANAMVTNEGRVKILDFGLAKISESGESAHADLSTEMKTREGVVMGTMPYMSPEQLQGRPLDHRTDIFSLGVMLYEMASGERPFRGDSSIDLASAILRDTPRPLAERRRELPDKLTQIIARCMEKSAADRFQAVREVRDALRAVSSGPSPAESPDVARAEEGPWIAVLPFKHSGANADLAALAEGLRDDIATGLSRFSYLRVMSHGSTADGGRAREGLNARYVMEGNLRQAGTKLRVALQLVDTTSGAHLWSETYDRPFNPEASFELQDDLVPRIVSTCADRFGVLARSISDAARGGDPDQLSPYQALMHGFGYHQRLTPAAHAEAREALERAVERAPSNAECWAMLSWIYSHEHAHGFNARPGSLERALDAARRAVDIAPTSQLAQQALAVVLFFRKETAGCLSASERAIALNPLDGSNEAMFHIAFTGDWERGYALIRLAMERNPHHPRWYGAALGINEYRLGNYRAVVDEVVKANAPEVYWSNMLLAAAYAQLGDLAAARSSLRDLLAQKENFADAPGEFLNKWFDPKLAAHLLDGLRKAGLGDESAKAPAQESSKSAAPTSGAARAEEGFWVAVLPFKYSGANAELTALADGLTEDIVTGLSRFSYLRVISRGSAADAQSAGKELGARYVMEGSLRQVGAKLRLAVQLVDATTGAHVWAENYERTFAPEAVFELQDDLVPRIVSTVADQYGALVHSMSESLRGRSAGEYSAHEAVLRAFGYWERVTPEEHREVREILEAAVARSPSHSDCLAELSLTYWHEYVFGYNLRPDPLGRARAAAQRAVASAPASHFAHCALATGLFFQKDFLAFRPAAERALALNRMDASTAAILGLMIAYAGDWEYGLRVVERAMQLNPHHPGWYHYVALTDAYRKRDYRGALASALKVNMPGYYWPHALLAAVYGQLGEQQRARAALRELHALMPDFGATAREEFDKWYDAELTEHLLDGLRKAGLEISPEKGTEGPVPDLARYSEDDSGAARAEEGFWVAVLPFKYSGANAELTVLAEGLTEDIVTGLSRFSYLRVIARSSTARYANESTDVRSAGKDLGARYVMEGSLRHAGTKLRLAVQLIEATTGAHLWAENYERTFNPDALFELQDELVPRIVSTVADTNGILAQSMSEAVRSRDPEQLTPYEAVLRSFGYAQRITPDELAAARHALELAVQKAPAHADAWAMLAWLNLQDYAQGFNLQADSLASGLTAAQRAVDAAPSNHLAWFGLAQALFFHKEFQSFRNAAERAVALNPMDGNSIAFLGELLGYAGDWERGLELAGRAKQLNPNYPGWYWYADFYDAYRRGDYRAALGFALKVNLPGQFASHAMTLAASGQLGEAGAASKALRRLLELLPDFAVAARNVLERWWDPEYIERIIDGWRKAGLEIPSKEESAASAPDLARSSAAGSGATRVEEGFWVAVLPFRYSGGNSDLTALAEGLTEDVVTGLSRFSYLRVIARSSTAHYSNESVDVRTAGRELGARYVMEGALRHAGAKLRVAVQLVDATTGAHLWAENYERTFTPESVFELQDELVPRVVSTIADWYGILPHSMSEAVRSKPVDQLSPYESLLRAFGYFERVTPEEHAVARPILERAVEEAPGNAAAWAMLSMLYGEEHRFGFNLLPDPLGRALLAARHAVEAAPGSHVCHLALAQAHYFRKEFEAFRNAAERAIALNPLDGATVEYLAHLLAFAGDWERGCELGEKARQLNPNHPAWYWALPLLDAFRRGDYDGSRALVPRAFMPGQYYSHALFAALYGQMGEREAAEEHVREALALQPDLGRIVRDQFAKWYLPQLVEQLLDGLRKAGLEIADEQSSAAPRASSEAAPAQVAMPISGEVRAEDGFWVAVLPFKYGGTNADLTVLAEGLTEEIVTGLSRFSYLRVIAQGSTARFKNEAVDIRSAGRELGARYVMEGSLRQAGSALRVSVQLVDANTGAHLWAETYERAFRPEDIFALQDDLVPRIVSTVADWYGVLPHSMSESLRSKAPDQLTPHEAVLRSFGYSERMTAEEHAAVRAALERAVEQAPDNADCWALLSMVYGEEYRYGFNAQPDPLGRSVQAARRAADAAPSNHFAWLALALALFYRKEFDAFRNAAERAIALNPMDGFTLARMGLSMAFIGDWERGCELAERATRLNPNHPGWYWAASFNNAYRKGDYRGALSVTLKMNMPGFFFHHLNLAAVYGKLGELEAAGKALQELLALKPDFALEARAEIGKFVNSELVEHFIDGLRKAGLDVPAAEGDRPEAGDDASSGPSKPASEAAVSIAVLPFSDMSAEKHQEYFCEGMAEEIMNALVRIDGIRVASRTSAFRAGRDGGDLKSIARALTVNHVLEGSVRTSGNRLRVTAQLTDVASGYQLWSERFDREAVDIFAVQDEITAGVVEAVKARLGKGERSVRPREKVRDLEAYRLYLKGRHLRYTKNDHGGALICYEQATALDPSHAPSWIGVAEVSVLASAYGLMPSRDAYAAAKAALRIAAGLQEESAEALYVEAMIAFGERRWKDSRRLLARATQLEPGHVQARCWTGILHCVHGEIDEALEAFEQARAIDPLAPYPYAMSGLGLLQARRAEDASPFLDQALAFDADNILALWVSGAALTARGLFDPAIARLERAVALANRGAFLHGTLGWALAEAGRVEEANAVLAALRSRPAPASTALPEAWLLAALDDCEGAWQVLDRACDEKQLLIPLTGLPGFDRLRTDPRFGALLEKMGLAIRFQ